MKIAFLESHLEQIIQVFIGLCLIICAGARANAGTYYIAASGSDSSDGQSEQTPWQTLAPVNAMSPNLASSSVFLLKRGDVFRGEIALSGDPENVTFGAYGTGEPPVVSGSIEVTGWAPCQGAIFRQMGMGIFFQPGKKGNVIEGNLHEIRLDGKKVSET